MDLNQLIADNQVILLDGAMGTMLISKGLVSGSSPEAWNVDHPEQVRSVHREYIQAGAQIILTNSFGGNRFRLAQHNLQDRVSELNQAAARNARAEAESAASPVLVAGSMGPTGSLLKPYGPLDHDDARQAYAEQAAALTIGGVDSLWIETMSDLNEVLAAVEGARQTSDLPITATLTFDTNGRTMMGVKPEKALDTLSGLGLTALGANCGTGPQEIEAVIESMHHLRPEITLIAKPNAGIPEMVAGEIIYTGTPHVMAAFAQRARDLGASLIGACCGSTPAHIQAMAEALF